MAAKTHTLLIDTVAINVSVPFLIQAPAQTLAQVPENIVSTTSLANTKYFFKNQVKYFFNKKKVHYWLLYHISHTFGWYY